MLQFIDGFDQLTGIDSDGNPSPLQTVMQNSGYTLSGAVSLDVGRTQNTQALKLGEGAAIGSIKRTFNSTLQLAVIGFAYKATSKRNTIVDIANLGALTWNDTTGKLSLAGGTGTATILLNLWYYFEIVIDKTNGAVQLWVNNGKDIEVALPSSAQFLNAYTCTWASVADDSKMLDDLYFLDNAAGRYTARMGPMTIMARLPTSDVDREWTPSTGVSHWPLVANQPPVDEEFVQSNTSGATDTYLSNQGLPQGAQILAVGLTVLNKKSDIDARQLGLVVGKKGDPQVEKIDTALSVDPKYSYAVFESAPDGSAWTDPSVTSVPFGVIVRP